MEHFSHLYIAFSFLCSASAYSFSVLPVFHICTVFLQRILRLCIFPCGITLSDVLNRSD